LVSAPQRILAVAVATLENLDTLNGSFDNWFLRRGDATRPTTRWNLFAPRLAASLLKFGERLIDNIRVFLRSRFAFDTLDSAIGPITL